MAVFESRGVVGRGGVPSEGSHAEGNIRAHAQSISMELKLEYGIPEGIRSSADLLDVAAREVSRDRRRIEAWAERALGMGSQELDVGKLNLVHSEFHTNALFHALLGITSPNLAAFQDPTDPTGDALRADIDARLNNKDDPIHKASIEFTITLEPGLLTIKMSDSGMGPAPTEEAFAERWKLGLRHLQPDHNLASDESGRGLTFLAYFMDGKGDILFEPRTESAPYSIRINHPLSSASI